MIGKILEDEYLLFEDDLQVPSSLSEVVSITLLRGFALSRGARL